MGDTGGRGGRLEQLILDFSSTLNVILRYRAIFYDIGRYSPISAIPTLGLRRLLLRSPRHPTFPSPFLLRPCFSILSPFRPQIPSPCPSPGPSPGASSAGPGPGSDVPALPWAAAAGKEAPGPAGAASGRGERSNAAGPGEGPGNR